MLSSTIYIKTERRFLLSTPNSIEETNINAPPLISYIPLT